jgi:hypothetical protein
MMPTIEMLENATDTYNGETGCACGCGGTYASTDSLAGQKLAAFDFGGGEGCIELENKTGTRVTRVYYKVAI